MMLMITGQIMMLVMMTMITILFEMIMENDLKNDNSDGHDNFGDGEVVDFDEVEEYSE
jgi:hypothetical protein